MPESRGSDINGITLDKLYKDISSGEEPICFISEDEMNFENGKLIFFTSQGMVKISDSSEFNLAKSGVLAIKLKDGDELIKVEPSLASQEEMIFVTQKGMCVRAGKEDVPVQGRTAGGVKGINLASGDKVVYAKEFTKENAESIIVSTDKGYYKKVSIGTITKIARAGKGVRIVDILEDVTAKVIFAYVLSSGENTVIYSVTADGIFSCPDSEVPLESRMSKGKNLRRLGSKPKLVCARARGYRWKSMISKKAEILIDASKKVYAYLTDNISQMYDSAFAGEVKWSKLSVLQDFDGFIQAMLTHVALSDQKLSEAECNLIATLPKYATIYKDLDITLFAECNSEMRKRLLQMSNEVLNKIPIAITLSGVLDKKHNRRMTKTILDNLIKLGFNIISIDSVADMEKLKLPLKAVTDFIISKSIKLN